jgi:hypothetical protein
VESAFQVDPLFGAFYLFSIFMAFFVTLRMRQTVAAA